jgi:hypothetical protein
VLLALLVLAVISGSRRRGSSLLHGGILSGGGLGGSGGSGSSSGDRGIGGRGAEVLVLGAPLGGSGIVGTAELVELAISLELLLLKSNGAKSPSAGVKVALHDATLDLGNNAVVAGGHLDGRHLSNTQSNGLTLGGHEDNLLVVLNGGLCNGISDLHNRSGYLLELTISQETGKHELGTVADSVNGAVLDDQTLVRGQESLKRRDDLAEVRLVAGVVHLPLSIEDVVESDKTLGLVHSTTANTSKLLHVATDTEEETQVNTECSDVGTSLTADPEDTEVTIVVELDELALVDGSDTELTLDGRDQRRTLEERTGEGLESAGELSLATGQLVVEADDSHILLSGTLLRLDKTSGAVNADNQATGNLGIEGTAVTSLLTSIG